MTTLSPPISPQPHHEGGRPRAVSALSHASNRSRRSNGSSNKLELTESTKDKKRLNTKADPSKALNEAQPAAVALEESNLEDLRLTSHKDSEGNIIVDPDRSNPTRHRMERPLDTIRSFNAAAEGTSNRRSSAYMGRPPSQFGYDNSAQNRRGSYYGSQVGSNFSPQRPRPAPGGGGYYRTASYGFGPQSAVEEAPGASQQYGRPMRNPSAPATPYNGYHGHNGNYGNSSYNGYSGHNGPNGYNNGDSPMSAHSHQHSYETMTSGSDEFNKSTNPSSQNSSFDQLQQIRKQPEDYAYQNPYANEMNFGPVSPQKLYSPYGATNGTYGQQLNGVPPPPPKEFAPNNHRQPISLNASASGPDPSALELKKSGSAKRQSWIRRRFSRRDT